MQHFTVQNAVVHAMMTATKHHYKILNQEYRLSSTVINAQRKQMQTYLLLQLNLQQKQLKKLYKQKKPNIEIATTNSDNQQKTPLLKVINAYNLDQLQARYQQPNYTNCVPYLKGECPHGRRGLDEVEGEICSNLHPKKCFPWVRAGNNEQHGCTKGRDCEFYHPSCE